MPNQSRNEHLPKSLNDRFKTPTASQLRKSIEKKEMDNVNFDDTLNDNSRGAEYLEDFYKNGTL
jgi:hypothetical protein